MQSQNNEKRAGFPADKHQAEPVLPLLTQGKPYLDPSIPYTIQLVNAAADAILRMARVLEAVEPERFCGYYDTIEGYGCAVTDIADKLIDFAGHFAKSTM